MKINEILVEAIEVGKTVEVLRFDPSTNKKQYVKAVIDEFKKSSDGNNMVKYHIVGQEKRKRMVSAKVFKLI